MEQILLVYGLPKEIITTTVVLYNNTKAMIRSSGDDTNFFDIADRVLQGDTLAPYLLIICLDSVLGTSIDLIKENGSTFKKARSRQYPVETKTDADYPNDLALLTNAPAQAESLLNLLEQRHLTSVECK